MDNLLNVDPGLMFWTIINFLILLVLLLKLGVKPITNSLRARESRINDAIDSAEKTNSEAQKLLKESQEKLDNAQRKMGEIIQKGREQAEAQIRKASEEADQVKRDKVEEAKREIERSKEAAIKDLRTEVAGLVVEATEKLLEEKLDKDKHIKLIESYIDKIPKN
jgi:F-type H+-transporting ATPase subunit b